MARSGNGTEYYAYGPSNERVWKREEFTGGISYNFFYFYGADGALLTTNSIDGDWDYNVYFAGRTVWRESVYGNSTMPPGAVSPDRLGSTVKHFPFGDEPTSTTPNREKFATYYRDEVTALDYARNRYYSSTIARFTTADPYGPSARPGAPQSWNRYTYVGGDPVNYLDPSGLDTIDEGCFLDWVPVPCAAAERVVYAGGGVGWSGPSVIQANGGWAIPGFNALGDPFFSLLLAPQASTSVTSTITFGEAEDRPAVLTTITYEDGTREVGQWTPTTSSPSTPSVLATATQMLGSFVQTLGTFLGYHSPGVPPTSLPIVAGAASVAIPNMPGLTVEIPASINFNTGTITIGIGIGVGTPGANAGLVSLGTASNPATVLDGCSWGGQAQAALVGGIQVIGGTGNGLVVGPTIGSPGGGVSYTCSASFTLP